MVEAVTIARPYAMAVFRLAKERNALAKWSEMLALASAVLADAQMRAIIDDPKLLRSDVERLFLDVCGNRLDEHAINLIRLLIEYDRLLLLPEIARLYEDLKKEDEAILEAEITAAVKLDQKQVASMIQRLEARFGKKVTACVKVDPEILGGIRIHIGDIVIDASVRGRLQELATTLKA